MPTELYNATNMLGMLGANELTILSQQGHMDQLQDCGNGIYGPEAITKVLTIPKGRRVRPEFVEMTALLPTLNPIAVAQIPTASSTALEIVVFLCVAMLEVPPDEQYGTPIRVYTRFNKVSFQRWLQDWRHLLLRWWLAVSNNSELKVMLLLRLVILNLLEVMLSTMLLLHLGILNRLDVMLGVVLLDVMLDVMCHRAL
jgi:hypothetical protein